MKKSILILSALFTISFAHAIIHQVSISGFNYSPNNLTAFVGDTVRIQATGMHPTVQVSETTWNGNGTTQLSGGWGSKTVTFDVKLTTADDIFYVCSNHVGSGMKGKITVLSNTTDINEITSKKVEVYPNPAVNKQFNVVLANKDQATLGIYSLDGKLVESHKLINGQNSITSKAAKGNYLYYIKTEEEIIESGKLSID